MTDLAKEIENIWERRDQLTTEDSEVNSLIHEAINLLDTGEERVAEYDSENGCLLYTSPSPRDRTRSRMPSSA